MGEDWASKIRSAQVAFYTKYEEKHPGFIKVLRDRTQNTDPRRFARDPNNLFADGDPEKAKRNTLTFELPNGWHHKPYLTEKRATNLYKRARSLLKIKYDVTVVEPLLTEGNSDV